MTKTNKVYNLETLRTRRARLQQETEVHEANLLYNLDYTKAHFGKLLLGSTVSSTKSGISDVFSLLTGKGNEIEKPSAAMNVITSAAPMIWNIAQPLLLGLLVKKAKSLFTGKKKKKVKK